MLLLRKVKLGIDMPIDTENILVFFGKLNGNSSFRPCQLQSQNTHRPLAVLYITTRAPKLPFA